MDVIATTVFVTVKTFTTATSAPSLDHSSLQSPSIFPARCAGSLLNHHRGAITVVGWIAFAGLTYLVINTDVESKLYNPFEILGIKEVS